MIKKNALKPFIILSFFMMIACLYFWTTSRYPELSGKSILGSNAVTSSIGFAPIIEIDEGMPFWQKVFAETINWIHTNKKGMSFSFVIGAFFLSLLPLLEVRGFKNGFLNSVLGTFLGAPLGVCVNCAAPIARSLHAAGMALQTSLSALVASPTLNIVVVLMAFSVFPFYMAAMKLLSALAFILLIIPLACRFLFKAESAKTLDQEKTEIDAITCGVFPDDHPQGLIKAGLWSAKTYVKNLFYLLKIALPFMILAGFLGAFLTVLIPWSVIETLQSPLNQWQISGLIFIIAFFGALLPSPMAFDVVVSSALLQAGVPVSFIAPLLVTLGSFSIYAFFILWQAVSLRVAAFMMLSTVLLGALAGHLAIILDAQTLHKAKAQITQLISNEYYDPILLRTDTAYEFWDIAPLLEKNKRSGVTLASPADDLRIEAYDYEQNTKAGTAFTRKAGDALGILQPYTISYMTGPQGAVVFSTMSAASGDVHNDGWPDLLVMGDHEVRPNLILYANIGGRAFKRQAVPIPENTQEVTLVSLADLNGDGWLDIVFATLWGKNYVIYNQNGAFLEENLAPLLPEIPGTTMSIAYGDIEKDGKLDIFLGNWSSGPLFINNSLSKNILLKSDNQGGYKPYAVPGHSGETLTTLFTDINHDGFLDIYIGNDYVWNNYSDLILLGEASGLLTQAGENITKNFPGGQSTMSIDSGDVNNDLEPDYYIGQIAYAGQYVHEMSKIAEKQIRYADYCKNRKDQEKCLREMRLRLSIARVSNRITDACEHIYHDDDKQKCLRHLFTVGRCGYGKLVYKKMAENLPASPRYEKFCGNQDTGILEKEKNKEQGFERTRLQASNASLGNVLAVDKKDIANNRNVSFGAWTWNARFADLDNDGWQDLYLANGYSMPMALPTNIFYHNQGQGYFEDKTEEFGLESFSPTGAYTYLDIDNDGDLDIIAVPTDAPLELFINHAANKSIEFELRDTTGHNTHAIGAEITVHYMLEGKAALQKQIIKGSGGYRSYNQPIAHFGLKDASDVKAVEINWPDGVRQRLNQSFEAGKKYKITRTGKS